MTVHVTMLVSSLPEGFSEDERSITYADSRSREYTYMLHNSGALVVHKAGEVEVVYGPSAWESVQGDGGTGR